MSCHVMCREGRYLPSIQRYSDQAIPGKLKKHSHKQIFASLTTYMETSLKQWSQFKPGLNIVGMILRSVLTHSSLQKRAEPLFIALFVFLNFPFMCQNTSTCQKLNRPQLAIVYRVSQNEGIDKKF